MVGQRLYLSAALSAYKSIYSYFAEYRTVKLSYQTAWMHMLILSHTVHVYPTTYHRVIRHNRCVWQDTGYFEIIIIRDHEISLICEDIIPLILSFMDLFMINPPRNELTILDFVLVLH